MKKITSIFFLLVIAASVFSKVVVMADYVINKNYIATVLCENKAKPIMHCNGKCHLKKQMQKEEDQQKKEGQSSQQKFEVQFCHSTSEYIKATYFIDQLSHTTRYNNRYVFTAVTTFFHPPIA